MTVYFSLVMTVMVSLIAASIVSVKVSAGRMQAANAVDQALFSLFARYDRQLEEKYDLFFVDAQGASGGPDIAAVNREIEDAAEYILDPDKGRELIGGKSLLNLSIEQCALSGYTLATDMRGAPFAAQAIDSIKGTAALQGISALKEIITAGESTVARGEAAKQAAEAVTYEGIEEQAESAREKREEEAEAAAAAGESYELTEPEVPADFVNPLPILIKIKRKALLKALVPSDPGYSRKKVSKSKLVSGRKLASGVGVIDTTSSSVSGANGAAFKAYIAAHYTCYSNPSENSALAYQMEYILYGNNSDEQNLKTVLKKLILLREAINIACLYTDIEMSASLSETALFIGMVLWIPEAEPLIKLLLAAVWAYAESMVDVRALMEGKRVPYIKTALEWQTDLQSLALHRTDLGAMTKDSADGLNYREYLTILLILTSDSNLVLRAMDMTESEIRGSGRPDFRLDACIGAVTTAVRIQSQKRVEFTVEETMNYRDL